MHPLQSARVLALVVVTSLLASLAPRGIAPGSPATDDVAYAAAGATGASSAFGLSADVTLLPLLGASTRIALPPTPTVNGTSPPPYNVTDSVASIAVPAPVLGQVLQAGVVTVNAASEASPMSTTDRTSAQASVANLNLALTQGALPLLPQGTTLLGLTASTVASTAVVQGPCGGPLTATGGTTLANPTLTVLGVQIPISLNPAPNTVLDLVGLAGIRIFLNEQIVTGDGTTGRAIAVNAIRVSATNGALTGLGVLNGDIVIAQSRAELTCQPAPAGGNLTTTVTASPNPATVGQPVTKTVTVTNSGPGPATNVVVTDPLPAGLTFVSATPSQATCAAGPPLSCSLGTIPAGGTATVAIVVTPTTPGTVTNTATVASPSDPTPGNNAGSVTITVNPGGGGTPTGCVATGADLAITSADAPDPVRVGGTLTFTDTVTNNGPGTACAVRGIHKFEPAVTQVTASSTVGSCTFETAAQRQKPLGRVFCPLGNMAPGASVTVTIRATPPATGTMGSAARAKQDPRSSEINPANNEVGVTTMVTP